ncbi:Hypothetical predicted protein [Mytilus galloprovincialis]|uniref:Uncharacterized protein n=1 Tax=Mytilus galloprovincialis TaxID=29158 RepID=A0A8B6BZ78_MYTGA|nr:Hypothetical predicted protein [Mytilus galloprovincialis]
MEQNVLLDNATSELHSIKGMAQKNVAEKVLHQKLQKQIDKQKKAFVKQHSKDENELKLILQRLQLEQQLIETDVNDLSDEDAKDEKSSESSNEDDFISNPYPVMIMPKFSQLPVKQDKHKITVGSKQCFKMPRRKSLEYEDVDKIKSSTSGIRTTLLAASFISKLRSSQHKRQNDGGDDNYCDQWESTSSIRRPRKTIAEQNQHKLLQRAKSEILCRPGSGHSLSVSSITSPRRVDSSRHGPLSCKKDVTNFGNLQYEGTVEDDNISPRAIGRHKNRRGGSLKERKTVKTDMDSSKMRRSNSSKEKRKTVRQETGEEKCKEKTILDPEKLLSPNPPKVKEPLLEKIVLEDERKTILKIKHNRHGSLKERGELKATKCGGTRNISNVRVASETFHSTKKKFRKQKSLSTDSSPIHSTETSPTSKENEKQFRF